MLNIYSTAVFLITLGKLLYLTIYSRTYKSMIEKHVCLSMQFTNKLHFKNYILFLFENILPMALDETIC